MELNNLGLLDFFPAAVDTQRWSTWSFLCLLLSSTPQPALTGIANASTGFGPYNRAAQRWVPWLAAYTGARPGELCQLRGEDFKEVDGIKCVALLPDAGTIKTRKYRYVPLHPHPARIITAMSSSRRSPRLRDQNNLAHCKISGRARTGLG
jgi:integrase